MDAFHSNGDGLKKSSPARTQANQKKSVPWQRVKTIWLMVIPITELDDGNIYRKRLYLIAKTMVSG